MAKKKSESGLKDIISLGAKILKLVYIVLIIGIIFIITLLIKEWGILKFVITILKIASPLFIGFIIAWLFSPLVKKIKDKGVDKIIATLIVYIGFLLIVFLFISALIPNIYKQINEFIDYVPELLNDTTNVINNLFTKFNQNEMVDINSVKDNILVTIENYGYGMVENLPNKIITIIGNIFSGVGTVVISLAIGFYMLFDFDSIREHFLKLIPKKNRYEISTLVDNIGSELRKVVNGTFTCAIIVFIGASIGFASIGLEAPLLFGAVCGITDLIPYIGPFMGGSVAVVVGFSQSPLIGILAVVVVLIIQQLENIVIQPVVMSKASKLHPVTIMIGLIIFGHFWGIGGMILATPIISLIKVLFRFIVVKFELFNYPGYELVDPLSDVKVKNNKK